MKQLTGLVLAVVMVVGMAGSRLYAHDETFKGTVIASDAPKLKANVANLKVNVIDDKTKKESVMEFVVTAKTKVLRGDKEVKFADAHVTKGERIAVTVNHDESMTDATVIRLAAHAQ